MGKTNSSFRNVLSGGSGARGQSAYNQPKSYAGRKGAVDPGAFGARFADFHSKDSVMQNIASAATQTRRKQNVSTLDGNAADYRGTSRAGFSGGQRAPKIGSRGKYGRT